MKQLNVDRKQLSVGVLQKPEMGFYKMEIAVSPHIPDEDSATPWLSKA